MLTLEERRESFVEDALPCVAGTDYGDEKRVIARIGLGMGFDQGYIFAIDKACEWLKANANKYIVDIGIGYEKTELIVGGACWADLRKAMEE